MGAGNTQQAQNDSAEPVAQQGGSVDVLQRALIGVLVVAVVCLLFGGLLSSITGNLAEIERQQAAQEYARQQGATERLQTVAIAFGGFAAMIAASGLVQYLEVIGAVAFFLWALRKYNTPR